MVWDRRTVSRVLRDDHYTRMPRITVAGVACCSMTLSAEHNHNYSDIFGESDFSPKMAE